MHLYRAPVTFINRDFYLGDNVNKMRGERGKKASCSSLGCNEYFPDSTTYW